MNTIPVSLLRNFCIIFLLSAIISIPSNAQNKIPKNYIGVSGIVELNRLAVGTGVEYERWFFAKDQFAIGAKAHYIFPSKTINYLFSSNEGIQRSRQFQLMATSYFFTNPEKEPEGFFFSVGGGINFIKWEGETYDGSGNRYMSSIKEVSPGFDLSFGGQFQTNRTAVRVTGGYQAFPADKYNDFVSGNGISQFYIKVSLGF
ncbi:MAG TPA: hypothetical protein VFP97_04025 [Chitinophagaceae bacterium]|nr:hypothetical protein [Chitinophagaceae bacterium]